MCDVYIELTWRQKREAALRNIVTTIAVKLPSLGRGSGRPEEKRTGEKLMLMTSEHNLSHLNPVSSRRELAQTIEFSTCQIKCET